MLWAWMSAAASVIARTAVAAPPRTAISVSRGALTCGLTTVSVSVRFLSDADPPRPQNDPLPFTRSYAMRGAEQIERTAWPPTCGAYISNT